ncbi:hypothetical protein [Nocardioides lijunqiniae]|uniref:hypothetical protein n=1 Tax=Nocardioides lijunqiniae TaxID=2760832 RepID=UPI00187790BA|nr:hypothetical protein [Nocardioides lijunqiniae]
MAGAVATFTNSDASGAVALIATGALGGLLGLVGRWPTKLVVSGNEISWSEVTETVDEQIDAAQDAGDQDAVRQLEELRRRLEEMQRTGYAPRHPAAEYDEAVEQALRRALPGAAIRKEAIRSRGMADFEVASGPVPLYVESKFKRDPSTPFQGSTLAPLLDRLTESDRLLIVTNSLDTRGADAVVSGRADRVRIVTWLGPGDDAILQDALNQLARDAA